MARIRDCMGAGNSALASVAMINTSGQVTGTGTGSQGAGVLLSYANNDCVTASSLDTFVLPTAALGAQVGDTIYVTVETSTTGVVYPGGSDTIVGSTSAKSIAQHKSAMFVRSSSTNWAYWVTA